MSRMPVVFISDFGPMPAVEDDDYTESLGALGKLLPRPKGILVMSGHWEAEGMMAATAAAKPETIHDYSGFPAEYYKVEYPAPGDPALAREAVALLSKAGFAAREDLERGRDHGAWAPLSRLFPDADIPTVQLTVPAGEDPRRILEMGKALAPLREKGVLLLASGNLIHNLRRIRFGDKFGAPDAWAAEFDAWLERRLNEGKVEELVDYRRLGPSAALAAPSPEHFDPLFYILGAAPGEKPKHFFHAIRYGNGLLRTFAYGV